MEEQNSWLRRTKFSHTIYTRVDPRRVPIAPPVGKDVVVPFAPLSKDVERKLQKFVSMGKSMSMPVDRDAEDTGTALKHCASLPLVRVPSCAVDRLGPMRKLGLTVHNVAGTA